jgi:hypothetical protein
MALLALGSVTVASSGEVSKSGECEALYDLLYAAAEESVAEFGASMPTGADSVPMKRGLAKQATVIATYVHTALTTRATAKISTTDSALQRTPNPNTVDTATQGPGVDKFISIV